MSVLATASALMILRFLAFACFIVFGLGASSLKAETSAFDLAGPSLRVSVTQGGVTLPLSQVPNLSAGDRLRIAAVLPGEQGARYRMVLVFLRGATNPPPKNWLIQAEPWKPKKATIDVVVPAGAEQALVLLVPDTGGAIDAVDRAVRGRPGAFVRASQELNQAMLDRARLEAFLDHVRQDDPAQVAEVSPRLAESLAVRPDPGCLLEQPGARAACLTQGINAAVLADGQTNSIAQTLAGAPADIALQLSSTAQAGSGYYSPYIGVVRDLARILGAFQSAQLQFIPALSVQNGDTTRLLLNAVPSFRKPQSVLVAALPTVAAPMPPPLQAKAGAPLCVSRPGLVLPVVGAPLVFATGYARQMALRVPTKEGGATEIPVSADPARGGYVLAEDGLTGVELGPAMEGTLHGLWGFRAFDGPRFRLVAPAERAWLVGDDASLVVGRETPMLLTGGTAACVAEVSVEVDARRQRVTWTAQDEDRLALKVPLTDAKPGRVTLLVRSHGLDQPQRIELPAYAEVSRIAGFSLHAGDRDGVLTGTRLDQVATLEISGVTFHPGAFDRAGSADRLIMTTDMAAVGALQPGQSRQAKVALTDGRTIGLRVTVAPPRPVVTLVSKSTERSGPQPPVRLALDGPDLVPQTARLVFSLKAQGATRFAAGSKVEVAASETATTAILPLRLQDAQVAIAELDPQTALGDSAHGPLQFRVVQDGAAGDWQPLATLVRLPALSAVTCSREPATCVLSGTGLFLVRSVSAGTGANSQVAVPDGFTGSKIEVPRPATGRLTMTLRDAPQATAALSVSN
jgi:hypothetical protein